MPKFPSQKSALFDAFSSDLAVNDNEERSEPVSGTIVSVAQ